MLTDFEKVSMFFRNNYVPYLRNGHWSEATWEYIHGLPWFDYVQHYKIGIWQDNGVIVALCSYETKPGEAYIFTANGYEFMKPGLLEYAEKNLYSTDDDGKRVLQVKTSTVEPEFQKLLLSKGYSCISDYDLTVYDYSKGMPKVELPGGFKIITLNEENNYKKAANAVWQGFDHEDENNLDGYMLGLNLPHFRKDMLFIAKADNGDYCSYGLIWPNEADHYAFLEPLSTVPKYRRKGLAKALLYEAINRTAKMDATYMIGGSREFYKEIGFETYYTIQYYKKVLE
jgi:GNAT superfamily N-acetyltransferase